MSQVSQNRIVRKISVVGAGSWGTAVGAELASQGHDVTLWGRDASVLHSIEKDHRHPKCLPGVVLPASLKANPDLGSVLNNAEVIFCSIPTQHIREVFSPYEPALRHKIFVNTSKGIELGTECCVSEIARKILPMSAYAVLSGPSFALEVAQRLPTAVTVASLEAQVAEQVQQMMAAPYFRVYTSSDVIGVELAGALKNVIALAAGIVSGLGLGYNAQAAIINRGVAEMARLGRAKGAQLLTFLGLSGMGDLVLTCTGPLSRNRKFGEALGKGLSVPQIHEDLGGVAEGFYTAKSAYDLAQKLKLEMPITEQVYQILYHGRTPQKALTELMGRDLKEEWDVGP